MIALVSVALALSVRVVATAVPARGELRGTITVDGPAAFTDPLAALPTPPDDRGRIRVHVDGRGGGVVEWWANPASPGEYGFRTLLPARRGATGEFHGDLYADGAWLPVPVDGAGRPIVCDWQVRLRGPVGSAIVLNGVLGTDGEARWSGRADRVSIAVVDDPAIRSLDTEAGPAWLIERGPPTARRARLLAAAIAPESGVVPSGASRPVGSALGASPSAIAIVETPDLQRLARAGPGTVYLSDRAFRLVGPVAAWHVRPVRRAVFTAAVALPDGRDRALVGAAVADARRAADPVRVLRAFAWNPVVDLLLTDGTIPFYDDVFDAPFGGPPGAWEALDPRMPGLAVARQLDALRGPGTAARLATLLLHGQSLAAAAAALELPEALVAGWEQPYVPTQNYRIEAGESGLVVRRDAPPDAPAEVVPLRIDGVDAPPWVAGPGPGEVVWADARSGRVDPASVTVQRDRGDDAWPRPFVVVGTLGVYGLSPSQGSADVSVDVLARRRGDTRAAWVFSANHDAQDLGGLEVGRAWYLGALTNRRARAHTIYAWGGAALLDPDFRATERGPVAVGAGGSWSWDTRTDRFHPLQGHRVSVAVGAGAVPGASDRIDGDSAWWSAGASVAAVHSPHPVVTFAGRARAGWASGDVGHRLLPLGGASDLRAIDEGAFVGNGRAVAAAEARFCVVRNASVPLGFGWLSEVHLSPGIEAGGAWRDDTRAAAVGGTLGGHITFDLLGGRPSIGGITLAAPLATDGVSGGTGLQWYLDVTHPF